MQAGARRDGGSMQAAASRAPHLRRVGGQAGGVGGVCREESGVPNVVACWVGNIVTTATCVGGTFVYGSCLDISSKRSMPKEKMSAASSRASPCTQPRRDPKLRAKYHKESPTPSPTPNLFPPPPSPSPSPPP